MISKGGNVIRTPETAEYPRRGKRSPSPGGRTPIQALSLMGKSEEEASRLLCIARDLEAAEVRLKAEKGTYNVEQRMEKVNTGRLIVKTWQSRYNRNISVLQHHPLNCFIIMIFHRLRRQTPTPKESR